VANSPRAEADTVAAVDRMSLHVESAGDGEPVVFLHGVANSSRTYGWLDLADYRMVFVDFRGHGASPRAAGTYRLEDYIADALSVLEGVGPATLVGHSLGGVVAWSVAQLRPELVRAAFLEDPPLYMGEPAEHAGNPGIASLVQLRETAALWQAEGIDETTAAARLAAMLERAGRTAAELQTDHALRSRAYALLHLDAEVIDPVVDGSALARIDTTSPLEAPVLVLAADDALGTAFPSAHDARLAESHPGVSVVRVAGAGHSIHDERAGRDAYVERLRAFCGRHAIGG
jgi:pimeloyl-ACP methyl ester carboxylesterase